MAIDECPLCHKKMAFSERAIMFTCKNEEHGILRFFLGDQCYMTPRKEVSEELTRMGLKCHLVEEHLLSMEI